MIYIYIQALDKFLICNLVLKKETLRLLDRLAFACMFVRRKNLWFLFSLRIIFLLNKYSAIVGFVSKMSPKPTS